MKFITKALILPSILALCSTHGYANEQQKKAQFVKKIVLSGQISPYATKRLKTILRKAHEIDNRKGIEYGGIGCDFAEHYYLGHGNGDFETKYIKNWKTTQLPNGNMRVSFNTSSDAHLIEFDLVKQGTSYAVEDFRYGYSDNPKRVPKKAFSIKQEALEMIKRNDCLFADD